MAPVLKLHCSQALLVLAKQPQLLWFVRWVFCHYFSKIKPLEFALVLGIFVIFTLFLILVIIIIGDIHLCARQCANKPLGV